MVVRVHGNAGIRIKVCPRMCVEMKGKPPSRCFCTVFTTHVRFQKAVGSKRILRRASLVTSPGTGLMGVEFAEFVRISAHSASAHTHSSAKFLNLCTMAYFACEVSVVMYLCIPTFLRCSRKASGASRACSQERRSSRTLNTVAGKDVDCFRLEVQTRLFVAGEY